MITAVLAFLADTLIGDPRSKLHPVVLIGSLIASLERSLYHEGDTDRRKLWAGGLLAVTVLILVYNMTACLLQLVSLLGNQYVTVLAEAVLLSFTILSLHQGELISRMRQKRSVMKKRLNISEQNGRKFWKREILITIRTFR